MMVEKMPRSFLEADSSSSIGFAGLTILKVKLPPLKSSIFIEGASVAASVVVPSPPSPAGLQAMRRDAAVKRANIRAISFK